MSASGARLPYPGLRAFSREETDLFFGREGCVDDMVDRLARTRFLAVLGASGSGKSSLVRTGLLDALEIGLLHQAGSRWMIADFRPGGSPIANMAEGLLRASAPDPSAPADEEEVRFLRTYLARGPRAVVEWCEESLPEGTNLLLLVDQFEELFRYGAYAEREEAEAFVALLLESARAPLEEARIYVAITMRSEYLGAAALIDGLAEAINNGLYLTPRMMRDQVRDAIVGPAAVVGFTIEPALANRLLNDLTSFAPWEEEGTSGHQLERLVRRADQLPLMQHVLNRLWSIAEARSDGAAIVLTLADYEAVGGLRGALAAHGREILDELLPEHRAKASRVFRALTAGSSLAEAVRRPTTFQELVDIADGDEIAVREIVEAFRAPGRNFLMPPRPVPIRPTTLIDISHESLIRQWDEFAGWLQQEITAADTWRRLVDQAERYRRREANLLSGVALAANAGWWDKEQPTAEWARRYGGDYADTAGFLAESRRAEADARDAEAADRRQKSRNRLVTAAVILILCIVTPLTGFAGYMAWEANREKREADIARAAAESDRQAALEASAEAERQRVAAEEQSQAAEAARQDAERQRQEAERQRQQAEEQQRLAEAQRLEAEEQKRIADEQRVEADAQRRAAERERMRADLVRKHARDSNLGQLVERIAALQREVSWDTASNLLGLTWTRLLEPLPRTERGEFLVAPLVEAFARQVVADYAVAPDVLTYSRLTGWTGTSGRFRVYALDRKSGDGGSASGNKMIAVFDAMSGATVGSFELPTGYGLGSELDLVSPDGERAVIITDDPTADDGVDDRKIAVWARGQDAAIVPLPALGGEVKAVQIAPVQTGPRTVLLLNVDSQPGEIAVVDPVRQAITFEMSVAEIASAAGLETIDKVTLVGFAADQVLLVANDPGRVLAVDASDGTVRTFRGAEEVSGASLSPDGRVLYTLACPGDCTSQLLTAFDTARDDRLWVERVPLLMNFEQASVQNTVADGKPAYSVLVQKAGAGLVFESPKASPREVKRYDAATHARMGEIAYDGRGGYRVVESAEADTYRGEVEVTGILSSYRSPLTRQKLLLYVAPNSIAVRQDGDTVRIAGVTYQGNLLVYRKDGDGAFEEDLDFPQTSIALSDCIAAVSFSGDGDALLFMHVDGSLMYVPAIGHGEGLGWHSPTSQRGESVALAPSTPTTDCPQPDASKEAFAQSVVPVDSGSTAFAILRRFVEVTTDQAGDHEKAFGEAYWVDVISASEGEGRGGERGSASGPSAGNEEPGAEATRSFAPLRRAGERRIWIAGDPTHGRLAMVSQSAVDIVTPPPLDADVGAAASSDDAAQTGEAQRLVRWSEPRAAEFTSAGDIVVAYGDGHLTAFDGSAGASGQPKLDGTFSVTARITGLFASDTILAVADERDIVAALDARTGTLVGHARLPAKPSVIALQAGGDMLSVEWQTDSAATVAFSTITPPADITDMARLVAARSLQDQLADSNLDAIVADRSMTLSMAADDAGTKVEPCVTNVAARIASLEAGLLGGDTPGRAAITNCAEDPAPVLADAEALMQRARGVDVNALVEDEAFARVLKAAADGDADATRILGALLSRIATDRGDTDRIVIAREALRFGTGIALETMRAFAAGLAIEPALLDLAREHAGAEPTVHQLLAHAAERNINDVDALTEALFEYSIAETLYRQAGRADEAEFSGHRRAQLARILPDERVLAVLDRVEAWHPVAPADAPPPQAGAAAPGDDAMDSADRLAQRITGSRLLDGLRSELERTRIFDLATRDPAAAVTQMTALGKRTGAEDTWTPEMMAQYLALGEDIAERPAGDEAALTLGAEVLRIAGAQFKAPVQAQPEVADIVRRAADLVAEVAPGASPEAVATALNGIDFAYFDYAYGTLPGTGDAALVKSTEALLDAAAAMDEAVAARVEAGDAWTWRAAEMLFWRGVLVNDTSTEEAAAIFHRAGEMMRPLVDAAPDDHMRRFRYAEALRWEGLAGPSTPEIESVERKSAQIYAQLWEKRDELDPQLLSDTGTGYGFVLANLAQTIREVELANLADGRMASDHAAWFLEILALAADRDRLASDLQAAGSITGEADFSRGWYRMSTEGWPVAFVAGLARLEAGVGGATQCDIDAADPYDPLRRAPGHTLDLIDTATAEATCRSELDRQPGDGRTLYQLARLMSADTAREAEYLDLLRRAAATDVSPAYSLLAYAIQQKDQAQGDLAYDATEQRTVIEAFPALLPFLRKHAVSERERAGLAWFAGRVAALGFADGHLALADLTDDPMQKLLHIRIAERLLSEAGDAAGEAAARRRAGDVFVRKADADRIAAEAASWTPEALIPLPDSAGAS